MTRRAMWLVLFASSSLLAMDRLPTGAKLDPVGRMIQLGNMPLAMASAPDGNHVVVSLSGWAHQGLQVVNIESGAVEQTLEKKAAFLGLTFSADTLYASGGADNSIYVFRWSDGKLTEQKPIAVNYPAGLAVSTDGRTLYAAENFADDIAVIDIATSKVVQRIATDHYPYAIVIGGDRLYASAWGSNTVSTFRVLASGRLTSTGRLTVGRHPSAMLLSGTNLYVALASVDQIAVIDTNSRAIRRIEDRSPEGLRQGSTPNAFAMSGETLYVAEADNNAVAVFNTTTGSLLGRIPVDWYPLGLIARKDALVVLNGKGAGSVANPQGPHNTEHGPQFDLALINGTIRVVPLPLGNLSEMSNRVARANNWLDARLDRTYPPFKHVVYIIRENRTYDQILGDIPEGDGDRSLVYFGREITPNAHALAERFGLFDHFFVNAEVSSQGHVWCDAAYVTDYTEKTVQSNYSKRRPDVDEGDVDEPAEGFLWDSAMKKGISFRDYGEFATRAEKSNLYRASKRSLTADLQPDYPEFDMKISDQKRADIWLAEFDQYVKDGNMPALEVVQLPRDHTAGGKAEYNTPRACIADNDYALARMVEAVSKSPFWTDTVFFVVEDDAQFGSDHLDSHRSVALVISAYNRAGVYHRFFNTTDVVATIEQILGLDALSQFDFYGHPLADIFTNSPDMRPFVPVKPLVSLDEMNPPKGPAAKKSAKFDLSKPDAVDEKAMNEVLREIVRGK